MLQGTCAFWGILFNFVFKYIYILYTRFLYCTNTLLVLPSETRVNNFLYIHHTQIKLNVHNIEITCTLMLIEIFTTVHKPLLIFLGKILDNNQ